MCDNKPTVLFMKMFEIEPRNVEMLNRNWIFHNLFEFWLTFISKRLASVKFLSLAMDFWISLSISCQCRAFRDGFLKDVITGMPCLNSVTFSFKIGRTSLDGKPKKIKRYVHPRKLCCKKETFLQNCHPKKSQSKIYFKRDKNIK